MVKGSTLIPVSEKEGSDPGFPVIFTFAQAKYKPLFHLSNYDGVLIQYKILKPLKSNCRCQED